METDKATGHDAHLTPFIQFACDQLLESSPTGSRIGHISQPVQGEAGFPLGPPHGRPPYLSPNSNLMTLPNKTDCFRPGSSLRPGPTGHSASYNPINVTVKVKVNVWMDRMTESEPMLSSACCTGPGPYRPIRHFQVIIPDTWWKGLNEALWCPGRSIWLIRDASTNFVYLSVRYWSSLQCWSSRFFKLLVDGAQTTSSGRLFQSFATRDEKCWRLTRLVVGFLAIFSLWPRVHVVSAGMKKSSLFKSQRPWIMLYIVITSARRHRYGRDRRLNALSLSSDGRWLSSRTRQVALLCTLSTCCPSAALNGPHIWLPYSKWEAALYSKGSVFFFFFFFDECEDIGRI